MRLLAAMIPVGRTASYRLHAIAWRVRALRSSPASWGEEEILLELKEVLDKVATHDPRQAESYVSAITHGREWLNPPCPFAA